MFKKKILAIISARLDSKRLPNKALKEYKGHKIIDRIIVNLKASKFINKVIVATSKNKSDKRIYEYCKKKKINCFRGDEYNLIKRFYEAGKKYKPKIIVRATGDNPFISHEITNFLIKSHIRKNAEFTCMEKKYLPSGICPEIINYDCFKKILKFNINFNYSEYMTFYFINNPNIFNLNIIKPIKKFKIKNSKLRLTLDYKDDFIFFKKMIDLLKLKKGPTDLSKIYEVIKKNPNITKLNEHCETKWLSNHNLIKKINEVSKIAKSKL